MNPMKRKTFLTAISVVLAAAMLSCGPKTDPRLEHAFRRPTENGWTFVHLEGTPAEIGYQHGYLLAPEIEDGWKVIVLEETHDEKKDWAFFRNVAKNVYWPHIEREYRQELQGITDGVAARGVKMDRWDVVAMNAWLELDGYVKFYDKQHGIKTPSEEIKRESCSAFVATGSYTTDGGIVMVHNAWTNYVDGERWTIIFDIVPAKGYRILMDGYPGLIHSADEIGRAHV